MKEVVQSVPAEVVIEPLYDPFANLEGANLVRLPGYRRELERKRASRRDPGADHRAYSVAVLSTQVVGKENFSFGY